MSPFKYQKSCVSPASFSLSNQIHYPWKVWPKFRYCLPGFHSSYHQLVLSCKQSLRAQAIHNNPTGNKKSFWQIQNMIYHFHHHTVPKVNILSIKKSSKMSHSSFTILTFFTNFCSIQSDLSGNTVWP